MVCRDNLRLLGIATHTYASQYGGVLFSHLRINGDWGSFNLPGRMFNQLTNLVDERVVDCPNLYPFTSPGLVYEAGTRATSDEGAFIGYNYCGGIPETNMLRNCGWESPLSTSDDPSMPLYTDSNNYGWIDGYWLTAPHTAVGAFRIQGATFVRFHAPINPKDLGAEGGNVGLLDGSVQWKPIERMKPDNWIYKHDFGNRGMW